MCVVKIYRLNRHARLVFWGQESHVYGVSLPALSALRLIFGKGGAEKLVIRNIDKLPTGLHASLVVPVMGYQWDTGGIPLTNHHQPCRVGIHWQCSGDES
jgi:hypothetical protein